MNIPQLQQKSLAYRKTILRLVKTANAGHIGGLVAGALLGGAFALFPGRKAAIAIAAASCALLYLGLQIEPSAELLMLKKMTLARIGR